jgi:hypothetical protein
VTEPLQPIDPRRPPGVDALARAAPLTPVEREAERRRREQAREKRRRRPPDPPPPSDGHVDLRA